MASGFWLAKAFVPWQPFLAFYIWGAYRCHLVNRTEPSMCGGGVALCEITLTTCFDEVWTEIFLCVEYFSRSILMEQARL